MTPPKLRSRGHRYPADALDAVLPPTHRIAPATFAAPSPSCLGGSHRRCRLDADLCSCPCHHDPDFAARATGPAPVARATFPCPACVESFATTAARAGHLATVHPVHYQYDDAWIDCPYACGASFRTGGHLDIHIARVHDEKQCAYCPRAFTTPGRLALHIVRDHGASKTSPQPTEAQGGLAVVPESASTGPTPVGDAPGATASPVP